MPLNRAAALWRPRSVFVLLALALPGSVEAQVCTPTQTVSTTAALRSAIADPCVSVILLTPGVYALGGTELLINQSKTLRNAGGGEVILDAGGLSRVLRADPNNVIELDGLTITGGVSGQDGGGIRADADPLTIRNSTITGNRTTGHGGGLFMNGGLLRLENVTVSGNTASGNGGGMDVRGTAQLVHVTVASNTAAEGGGLDPRNTTVELINSIVADNVSSGGGGQIRRALTSVGVNLVEGGCLGCRPLDLTGDPRLLPLAANGGDTRTHGLDGPSIARDTADVAFALATDQRGVSRPIAWGHDLGAFEAAQAPYGIRVGPDGTLVQRGPGTGRQQLFQVINRSLTTEVFGLLGAVEPPGSSFLTLDSITGPGVTGAGASASVTVAAGATATVSAWFSVAAAPLGTVDTLRLTGTVAADPRYADPGWVEVQWVCTPIQTVSTTAALRSAVADPCVSVILLTPGVYALGGTELLINQSKTLRNAGGGEVILDAGGLSRVLRADPNNVIELDGLTITGGVSGQDGGGIRADANPLTIRNSTITGNRTTGHGGGLFMNGGLLRLENVTISSNTASGNGGGMDVRGTAQLVHVTVASNTAAQGGGLDPRNTTVQLINSIVADNVSSGGGGQIRRALTSVGVNLVEGGCLGCRPLDLTGDPRLLPLAANGGNTRTHGLDGPSIARDTADVAFALATDQRGVSRPIAWGHDLGAFEAAQASYGIRVGPDGARIQRSPGTGRQQLVQVINRSLTTEVFGLLGAVEPPGSSFLTLDSITGPGVTGAGASASVTVAAGATATVAAWFSVAAAPLGTVDTLRLTGTVAADPRYTDGGWVEVQWACNPTETVSTTFELRSAVADPCVSVILLTPGVYALGGTELLINQSKTLRNAGGGAAILDAGRRSRVLRADPNNVIELDGLTITGGVSGQDGGGIRADADPLTIRNSTITGNRTTGHGGGLFMNGGLLRLENVTINGNTASGNGGGMDVRGTAQLVHVTVANNTAAQGGGLDPRNTTVQLINSIVADNVSTGGGGQIRRALTSVGVNLVEGGCLGCRPLDLTGDPALLPLADNGGNSQTRALGLTSIARDTADVAFTLATDQRGISRPQGRKPDLGAFEASGLAVSLAAAAASAQRLPSNGTGYRESFTLSNTGPASSAYRLQVTALGGAAVVDSIRGLGITFGARPDSALTATLAPLGGSVAVSVFYSVPGVAAGTTGNLALTATSVLSSPITASAGTTVTVVRPSLGMTKIASVAGDTIPGANVAYQVTVTNLGTEAAVQVVVRDSIPGEVDYLVASTGATLPAGVTATLAFDDGTGAWTYVPVSGGCGARVGYDRCVRYIRWTLGNPLVATPPNNAAVFSFTAGIR